ncbi:DUF3885 domain-containing protein [Hymenobacter cellulosivorans]|uniref:DUF3885 domain-containing protein n=1 Tax=Hymenobacter cellulosivorans TaxID=2932249 RepID=A0ABY4FEX9_9BACT|nr:DUF3885 domain-containing protein [Hymenobacter cellulosivorans]UOQ55236.1 DUF3885 domain-containing protein [Hymenobacter cellulosivorans]
MPPLPSTAFIQQHFPGLFLSSGLFYRWPIGIRFDLQGEHPIYLKPGHPAYSPTVRLAYNEAYFREVNHRASTLFHAAFQPDDELVLVYQKSAYKRGRIKTTDFLLRQLGILRSEALIKKIANPYRHLWPFGKWVRLYFSTSASAVPFPSIAAAIANQDFRDRAPAIRGDVFLLNLSRGLLFHLYDDRGLDILAADKATLQPLFETYNSWLLDYDRARVEETFFEG